MRTSEINLGLQRVNNQKKVEKSENARKELEKSQGGKPVSQKMFRAI